MSLAARLKDMMAVYLTTISFGGLFLVVVVYTRVFEMPSWDYVRVGVFGS
jgi:hypothetical protein